MKIQAGIIGCGKIAGLNSNNKSDKINHASVYKNSQNINIVAAADINKINLKKFKEMWKVNDVYTDYKKMILENNFDVVSVCTPVSSHYEILEFLIKNKIKRIFCEKPLCNNTKQIKKLIKNNKKSLISINYFRRWNPDLIELKKNITKLRYGKLNKITFNYSKSLLNNGLHLLDFCIFLIGKPDDVIFVKKSKSKLIDGNYGYDFILNYKKFNITANFNHVPNINYVFLDCEMFFTNYYIHLKKRFQLIEIYNKSKDDDFIGLNDLKLIKKINTNWKQSMTNAIEELMYKKNTRQLSHNLNNSLDLIKIYEKISN